MEKLHPTREFVEAIAGPAREAVAEQFIPHSSARTPTGDILTGKKRMVEWKKPHAGTERMRGPFEQVEVLARLEE